MAQRDLRALRRGIEAYPEDCDLWRAQPSITNSPGNQALHLAGNLQYFIGSVLGGTGYVRDREAEFGQRDVPPAGLLRQIDAALAALAQALARLSDQVLRNPTRRRWAK